MAHAHNIDLPATGDGVSRELLSEIERTAVEIARLAGAEITTALGRALSIKYKGDEASQALFRDPVSEVDQKVEALIRLRLSERFPGHDIIGEEMTERPARGGDFVWAVDPVDGTANFINGFPLFAASIGVLYRGRPVAGAVWCATTHALRAGVYHARAGSGLCFEEEPIRPRLNQAVRRRLAGDPQGQSDAALPWDARKTGSAAIECAFVAAGLLQVARFASPNLWDVAGGLALVQAAGGEVWVQDDAAWRPLDRLTDHSSAAADLRHWHAPLVLGDRVGVALLTGSGS